MQGDQVQISVWGFSEFNTTTTVKETGTIVIPLIGEMQAARLTKEEFTTQLKSRLAEYIKDEPRLTVSIVNLAGLKVSVMGAVSRQDNYPVVGEVTLIEMLTSAGGATEEADIQNIKIFRNGLTQNYIEIDLPKHMAHGEVNRIPMVRPGDTVFVPRQENLVRELSEFMRDVLVVFGFFTIVY
jgi:polysaccharide export outer membrane protein